MRFKSLGAVLGAVGAVAILAGTAHAQRTVGQIPLAPGAGGPVGSITTFLGNPTGGTGPDTLLAEATSGFSGPNVGGDQITGNVYSAVYDLGSGLLGFYYQVTLNPLSATSTSGIDIMRINGFQNATITDHGQFSEGDPDNLGAAGNGGMATITSPTPFSTVTRSTTNAGNVLTFSGSTFVSPGQVSAVFYAVVQGGSFDPTGGIGFIASGGAVANSTGNVYTPVTSTGIVPEPGTMGLLAAPMLGMVGMVAARRRRAK